MIDRGKRNVAGINISVIDYEAAVSKVIQAAKDKQKLSVSALAVHGVMTGVQDDQHRHRLNQLDLVVPDGQPVRWALKWLHNENLPNRVYGPELMKRVCAAAESEGLSIFLYGSRKEVIAALQDNLLAEFPNLKIAGSTPSQFRQGNDDDSRDAMEKVKQTGADIVFVGLGCPRQEVFAYENAAQLSVPTLAVGAAFDFHAGLLSQAPGWMGNNGLEWLYRLIHEPKRLWRRYLYLNPLYLMTIFSQWRAPDKRLELSMREPSRRENYL
nr:WecB/TagA/CpsF family glycosyltransferase [uncultured Cohaesibacter sp.]